MDLPNKNLVYVLKKIDVSILPYNLSSYKLDELRENKKITSKEVWDEDEQEMKTVNEEREKTREELMEEKRYLIKEIEIARKEEKSLSDKFKMLCDLLEGEEED